MDIHKLIPKDKHDFETVELLKHCDIEEIKPIIPDLLIWQQDMNWPIANEIQKVLLNFKAELVPHIRDIFLTMDGEWKYWIVTCLLNEMPVEILKLLRSDLERIKDNPTDDEICSEVNIGIERLLNRLI